MNPVRSLARDKVASPQDFGGIISNGMKTHILGLKELRENMQKYASLVEKGESFIVIKKSKPVFKLVPPDSEEQWEVIADFTRINKNGIDAKRVLRELRKLHAHS